MPRLSRSSLPSLLLLAVVAALCALPVSAAGPFDTLSTKYGIYIRSDVESGDFFPEDWIGGDISAEATPISPGELSRFPALLARALGKYPASLISGNISSIRLSGSLGFYGQGCAATSSRDSVYLASAGAAEGYDDAYIEGSFHHEFSHMLLRNYAFPRGSWEAANPRGFSYGEGGFAAIEEGNYSLKGSPADYAEGFLCPYARSELEEDAAVFAERLMMVPAELAKIADAYPRIRKKLGIYVAFMRSAAPSFIDPTRGK